MRKNWPWLLALTAITAIAAFLRFHLLRQLPPGLWLDEAMNGINALEALRSGVFHVFYPDNGGREGLFINLQALSIAIFGAGPWALRLVSAAIGTLTVPAMYFLALELFGADRRSDTSRSVTVRWLALASAFFMAVSLWHVMASRIGLRVIMAPFFLTWSMFLLLRALNAAAADEKRRVWPCALAAGLVYGLGFHSYISYRITPLPVLLVFWAYWRQHRGLAGARRKISSIFLCFSVATMAAAAPLVAYFIRNPQMLMMRVYEVAIWSRPNATIAVLLNELKTVGMFFFVGDSNGRSNFSSRPELYWPLGSLFIAGTILAVMLVAGRRTGSIATDLMKPRLRLLILYVAAISLAPLLLIWISGHLQPQEVWLLLVSLLLLLPGLILSQTTRTDVGDPTANPLSDGAGSRAAAISLGWLLFTAIPPILSAEEVPHAPRALLMAPAVFLLAAFGAVMLFGSFMHRRPDRPRTIWPVRLTAAASALILLIHPYQTYFQLWARDPDINRVFLQEWIQMSAALNSQPDSRPKFVIINDPDHILKDPLALFYPIMFLTDTYSTERQRQKNMRYLLPGDETAIPDGAFSVPINAEE
jgi:4-amino-4-deoxy-L-arabinose transferase-like glycosyltransferase